MGGRGQSNPQGGGGSGGSGGGNGKSKNAAWKSDYNRVVAEEEKYTSAANAMDAEVKAAKAAWLAAPTRSKAQKAEAARLEQRANELSMRQSMLRFRAAQMGTVADRMRMENDPAYRRRRNRQAAANARRNYR